MKLYTEEQVLEIIANLNRDVNVSSQELLEGIEVGHIELPSDEEIEKIYEGRVGVIRYAFIRGAKWMRNKIQGGNK